MDDMTVLDWMVVGWLLAAMGALAFVAKLYEESHREMMEEENDDAT